MGEKKERGCSVHPLVFISRKGDPDGPWAQWWSDFRSPGCCIRSAFLPLTLWIRSYWYSSRTAGLTQICIVLPRKLVVLSNLGTGSHTGKVALTRAMEAADTRVKTQSNCSVNEDTTWVCFAIGGKKCVSYRADFKSCWVPHLKTKVRLYLSSKTVEWILNKEVCKGSPRLQDTADDCSWLRRAGFSQPLQFLLSPCCFSCVDTGKIESPSNEEDNSSQKSMAEKEAIWPPYATVLTLVCNHSVLCCLFFSLPKASY